MTAPDGVFYAALDADSEHEEGKFYLWTPAQVAALLTPEENAVARLVWGLDGAPNFEGQAWHLGIVRDVVVVQQLSITVETATARMESARAKLFAAREQRIRPGRDDKVLTSWNTLMIKGLARATRRFARPDWLALAQQAAAALHGAVWQNGRLLASYKDGQARHNAYLDDYAFLLDALLELLQAQWRGQDWRWALALAEALMMHFHDEKAGGFFFTSHDHEKLIQRAKPAFDNALPSGNGVVANALNRMGMLTGEARYTEAAEGTVRAFLTEMQDHPAPFPTLLGTLEDLLAPPTLVVPRGPGPELFHWQGAADRVAAGRGMGFALGDDAEEIPAGLAKPGRDHVNVHVCGGVTCTPEIFQLFDLMDVFRTGDVQ
jgi:uncharacterized protein YyaL (SSP411 family)